MEPGDLGPLPVSVVTVRPTVCLTFDVQNINNNLTEPVTAQHMFVN